MPKIKIGHLICALIAYGVAMFLYRHDYGWLFSGIAGIMTAFLTVATLYYLRRDLLQ